MRRFCAALIFVALCGALTAQTNPTPPLQQWFNENLDPGIAQLLDQYGVAGAADFFTKLQHSFDDTNIFEMGSQKEVAVRILPVLDQYEETEGYAVWLRAHMDELDAAQEIQRQIRAEPSKSTNMAVVQRSVWVKQLKDKPWPPLARKYVPKLKKIFIAERVPSELVWVAGVESGFDARARSPAGAAGMFQLMPATARDEHLSLWPFDQRYNLEKSAHAAGHYLHALRARYHDWPLALAAYNVGPGRVDKLLHDHNAHSFDGIARWLPAETQMYVPKIEATIREHESRSVPDLPAD